MRANAEFHFLIWAALAAVLLTSGCTMHRPPLIDPSTTPVFFDDREWASLQLAITQQRRYLAGLDQNRKIELAGRRYSITHLDESLATLEEIISLEPDPMELDRIIKENFTILQAAGRTAKPAGEMLVTGYYEPLFEASVIREPPFIHPIYAVPADLVQRRNSKGEAEAGRVDESGHFRPYWTREEIDGSDVLAGHELVYLKHPFDAFLLHVQGSGKVRLRDGSVRSLRYGANNGHPYASIGRKLVDEGVMELEDVDIRAIRTYLESHPERRNVLLNSNPRYIFFTWGTGELPRGSLGRELTPGRSVACDLDLFPPAPLAYLVTQRPEVDEDGNVVGWQMLQRFVVVQDSGAAIKGPGRVDLFWGSGEYAEAAAGAMKERGFLYFLIKNDFEKP